jgi:putative transposase
MDQDAPPKKFYRRRLPHLVPAKGCFFVTFHLHGALPRGFLEKWENHLKHEGEPYLRWLLFLEQGLRQGEKGSRWLADPVVAMLVYDAILFRHQEVYQLDCFTIMSNHVHMLFTPIEKSLPIIMKSLKTFTAKTANQVLGQTGSFWQHESFDHLVRSRTAWQKFVRYIVENPVRANLVQEWHAWPYTWCSEAADAVLRGDQ